MYPPFLCKVVSAGFDTMVLFQKYFYFFIFHLVFLLLHLLFLIIIIIIIIISISISIIIIARVEGFSRDLVLS